MSLIICPECQKEFRNKESNCPYCKKYNEFRIKSSSYIIVWSGFLIFGMFETGLFQLDVIFYLIYALALVAVCVTWFVFSERHKRYSQQRNVLGYITIGSGHILILRNSSFIYSFNIINIVLTFVGIGLIVGAFYLVFRPKEFDEVEIQKEEVEKLLQVNQAININEDKLQNETQPAKWYIKVLKNYFHFSGRSSRKEFWVFMLLSITFLIVCFSIMFIIYKTLHIDPSSSFVLPFFLVYLIPNLAFTVRRLHDVGNSGWVLWIALIPLGIFWILGHLCSDGDDEDNEWGINPKENISKYASELSDQIGNTIN
ncbi:MAG: DUF805 domain-containing protein [Ignavibacteriaceae bacterium]